MSTISGDVNEHTKIRFYRPEQRKTKDVTKFPSKQMFRFQNIDKIKTFQNSPFENSTNFFYSTD